MKVYEVDMMAKDSHEFIRPKPINSNEQHLAKKHDMLLKQRHGDACPRELKQEEDNEPGDSRC